MWSMAVNSGQCFFYGVVMSRKIPLTQGQFAIVDDADYEDLMRFNWCANKRPNGRWYAERAVRKPNGKQTIEYMHRRILGLKPGDKRDTDH